MLGFSPLASAPLGDDGVVTSDVFQLQSIVLLDSQTTAFSQQCNFVRGTAE